MKELSMCFLPAAGFQSSQREQVILPSLLPILQWDNLEERRAGQPEGYFYKGKGAEETVSLAVGKKNNHSHLSLGED